MAIGDIHGNAIGLREVLDQLRDDITGADTVVFLGDYIDRGSDSKGCIDQILAFRNEVPAHVVCLAGNHEDWMLRSRDDYARHSWLIGMDAFTTVESYSRDAAEALRETVRAAGGRLYTERVSLPYELFFDAMPASHAEFFGSLTVYYQNDDAIFVHAGLDCRVPLDAQSRESLLFGWDDARFPERYDGNATVVYGHRNNAEVRADGWPLPKRIGRTIGLDSSRHGVVTAIRLPEDRVFQSQRHSSNT